VFRTIRDIVKGVKRQGNKETRKQGDGETERTGDEGTRREGDLETRGPGDRETSAVFYKKKLHMVHLLLFTYIYYFY
jgi:hypothetical protein